MIDYFCLIHDYSCIKVEFGNADFAVVSAAEGKPARTYLRLVRIEKAWLIDYAIFPGTARDFLLPGGDEAALAFTAIAFAEALASKNFNEVEALFTKGAKSKLAPPLFETDKEQGYNRAKLKAAFADLYLKKFEITGLTVTGHRPDGPGKLGAEIAVSESGGKLWLNFS